MRNFSRKCFPFQLRITIATDGNDVNNFLFKYKHKEYGEWVNREWVNCELPISIFWLFRLTKF